jgi:uncharacterized protein (TIGR00661 family)
MFQKKKFMLCVQGEGRGHMTQSISMYELLIGKGHEVVAVVLGSSGKRDIPDFFYEKVKTKIFAVESPNFVTDNKNKSIKIGPSVIHGISHLNTYKKSLDKLHEIITENKPDVIVNFFDLLIGLYYWLNKPRIPIVCIAHQYIYLHRGFKFPRGHFMDRMAIKFYTKLTAIGSKKRLALSFYNMNRIEGKHGVVICPPLLRKELFELQPSKKTFYLIYLVNYGYYEDIVEWHKKNQDVELHCYTDKSQIADKQIYHNDNLVLHQLNDTEFLEKMAAARGLISTAGFEAVCEAMYLGKPVLMVPIEGHYEQFCNSRDAFKAGAGIYDKHFNIDKLIDYTSIIHDENKGFKQWVTGGPDQIYKELCSVWN